MCEATSRDELNTVYIHLNLLNKDSAVKSTLLSFWLPPCGSDPHHGGVLGSGFGPVLLSYPSSGNPHQLRFESGMA